MTVTKRIVCLANSRKRGGRCVAGKELAEGKNAGWIRPVSSLGSHELMGMHRRFVDGREANILDVVEVALIGPQPTACQTENWLIDSGRPWQRVGRIGWDELAGLVDPVGPLWVDGYGTKMGLSDRIPAQVADGLKNSLRLIHVSKLKLIVSQPGLDFGNSKKRLQAAFSYAGRHYRIGVTDSDYECDFLARDNGEYHLDESYLTTSIAEPHTDGFCYKLVAAIIEREGRGRA
jgi:hypothetical protein